MGKTMYDGGFYDRQMHGSRRSAERVVPMVLSLIQPKSVIDVGCGVGTWLSVFHEQGIQITGIDGEYVERQKLFIPAERFCPSDLGRKISHQSRHDLVVSLEVAEHLPARRAAGFVADLVALGPVILFSAAIPGQGGHHHVNEQWPDYWRDLFAKHDYVAIDCLRARLWNHRDVQVCYRQNILIYAARAHLASVPQLAREHERTADNPLSIVHPEMFTQRLAAPMTLRYMLRAFPAAASAAVMRRLPSTRHRDEMHSSSRPR
jgi:hypothetical protein